MIELMDDSSRTATGTDPGGQCSGSPYRQAVHPHNGPGHDLTRYAPSSLSSVIRSILYFHGFGQRLSGSVCPESHALRQVLSSLLFTGSDLALMGTGDNYSAAADQQARHSTPFPSSRTTMPGTAAAGAAGARARSTLQPSFARSFISSASNQGRGSTLSWSGPPSAQLQAEAVPELSPSRGTSDEGGSVRTFNLALLTGGRRGRKILSGSDGEDDGSDGSSSRGSSSRARTATRTGRGAPATDPATCAAPEHNSGDCARAGKPAPAADGCARAAAADTPGILAPFIAAPLHDKSAGGCVRSIAHAAAHSNQLSPAPACGRLYAAATCNSGRSELNPYYQSHADNSRTAASAILSGMATPGPAATSGVAPAGATATAGDAQAGAGTAATAGGAAAGAGTAATAGGAAAGAGTASGRTSLYRLAGMSEPLPGAASAARAARKAVPDAPAATFYDFSADAFDFYCESDDCDDHGDKAEDCGTEVHQAQSLVRTLKERGSEVTAIALQRRSHALMDALRVMERRSISSSLNGSCCRTLHILHTQTAGKFEAKALIESCSDRALRCVDHSIGPLCQQLTELASCRFTSDSTDSRLENLTSIFADNHKSTALAAAAAPQSEAAAGAAAGPASPAGSAGAACAAGRAAARSPYAHHFIMPVSSCSTISLSCCSVYSHVQGRVFERMARLRARQAFRHIRPEYLSDISQGQVVFDLQAQQRRDRAAAALSGFAALLHLTSGPQWNRRRLSRLSLQYFSRLS